ncbi:MAG: hypothetical protein JRH07_06675 [Deltaproteobacteria bacterium]|nr:hypothetical protein [Deltaproteobacteria bacterium]MBW2121519.1 hypothetical protein [Deltaproteobacteria bacterium]
MRRNLQLSDVVLVHIRERPAFYAQVKALEPDVRKGWYRVTLGSPLGDLQWILEDVHLFLGQTWTFGGVPYRMVRIRSPKPEAPRVVSFRRVK